MTNAWQTHRVREAASDRMRDGGWVVPVSAGAALVLGCAVVENRQSLVAAAVLGGGACLYAWKPQLSVYATLFAAFAVFPSFVHALYNVGLFQVPPFEPFLVLAVVHCVMAHHRRDVARRALIFAAAVTIVTLLGLAHGNDGARTMYEAKTLLDMVGAYYVAGCIVGTRTSINAKKVLTFALWWSLALTLAAAFGGLAIGGTTGAVGLLGNYTSVERFQTAANFPALVVLCSALALVMVGRIKLRSTLSILAPALMIVFFSFSRNNIVAVVAALGFAVVANRTVSAYLSGVWKSAVVLVVGVFLVLAPTTIEQLPGGHVVATQVSAYSQRVLNGLTSETRAIDPSTQDRYVENAHMRKAISQAPLVGHGLGFAYQIPSGVSGSFTDRIGPYYGHNFYYWWYMKAGLLGALALLVLVWPVLGVLRKSSAQQLAVGAAVVGVLTACVVAPLPLQPHGAVVFGAVLGTLAGVRRRPEAPSDKAGVPDYEAGTDKVLRVQSTGTV